MAGTDRRAELSRDRAGRRLSQATPDGA